MYKQKNSKILNEDNRMRNIIRSVIRDIVLVYKNEDEGEFYLPEYFEDRDKMVYDFIGLPAFTLEVNLIHGDVLIVDAEYYRDEEVIKVDIVYNELLKDKLTFEIIGELNDVISHELRHIQQKQKNLFDFYGDEPEDPFDYYTQPHELDAQYFGFKRLSKLTKKPFEKVVRRWFETHKSLHNLTKDQEEIVIDKILNYRKK